MPINKRIVYGRYRATHLTPKSNPNGKDTCDVCGKPIDIFHDGPKCATDWLKRQDAEGNPSNTRKGVQG